MSNSTKPIGIIGLGNMGSNVAAQLINSRCPLVLYNRTPKGYIPFQALDGVYLSEDIKDFASRLMESQSPARVWMMVPGGSVTNGLVRELSTLLRRKDIVIDASNSIYTDSIANYKLLRRRGISYLDVGCAGGPGDLLRNNVSLMVGGDRVAFKQAEDIFKVVAGDSTYGYVGTSGSGHMAKLVHNIIFYAIFPIYAEGTEFLLKMRSINPSLNVDEALRLLLKSPPITTGILRAILETTEDGSLPRVVAPKMEISSMVKSGMQSAAELGVALNITRAILENVPSMSKISARILADAKKNLTYH